MTLEVTHVPSAGRFVAVVEGQESGLDYHLSDNTMTITHTGVPPSLRGRDIAGEITRFALETARAHGWKVVPVCPFAASFLKKHTEYSDLLA